MKRVLIDPWVLECVPDLRHHVDAEGDIVEELVDPGGCGKERINLAKGFVLVEVNVEWAMNREQRCYEPMRRQNKVWDRNPQDDVSRLFPAFLVAEEGIYDEEREAHREWRAYDKDPEV